MTDWSPRETLARLREAQAAPIAEDWVPGAANHERRALGVLGAVAVHALGGSAPTAWDQSLRDWFGVAADAVLPEGELVEVDTPGCVGHAGCR